MDVRNCHYQVDPYTGQPVKIQDGTIIPPVCKTNFGYKMDVLRDTALGASR